MIAAGKGSAIKGQHRMKESASFLKPASAWEEEEKGGQVTEGL